MPKNKIEDLRNHLFAQLERLSDDDLTMEQLHIELDRSAAITRVAASIIESAKVEVAYLDVVGGSGTGFIPDIDIEPQKKLQKPKSED